MSTAGAMETEWGECWLPQAALPKELENEARRVAGGSLLAWAPRLAPVPWVLRAFIGSVDGKVAHMPKRLFDFVHFAVSQDNSCRYCYGATRTILRVLGYKEEMIDRLERDAHLAELTPVEQQALRFARKVGLSNPRPTPADMRALREAGLSSEAVAELATCAVFAGFGNRMATMFALPPEAFEHMLDNPLVRLMRPIMARRFRVERSGPFPLPRPNDPPCSELVAALDGCYGAHVVRGMLDDGLASPVLPRRSKLLMLAVIACALSSDYVEEEARRQLQDEGFGSGEVTHVLANLGSPRLDATEALLVPFARETVRYRPPELQDRTRELARRLSNEQVIEAAGMAAAANAVARLGVLLPA